MLPLDMLPFSIYQSVASMWVVTLYNLFLYLTRPYPVTHLPMSWLFSSQIPSPVIHQLPSNIVHSKHAYLPVKMEQCSETSAYKLQTPGNYSKESIQHLEHGEILKSMILVSSWSPVYQWTLFLRRFLELTPRFQVFYNRSIVTQITQDISRILWNLNVYAYDKSPSLALVPNQMNSVNTIPPTCVRSILILSAYINKCNNWCWNRYRPSYPPSARKVVIISYYLTLLNCCCLLTASLIRL
jgi:hypothetical protein